MVLTDEEQRYAAEVLRFWANYIETGDILAATRHRTKKPHKGLLPGQKEKIALLRKIADKLRAS